MSWRIQEADSKYISKNAKQFIQIAGLETSNTMSCIDLHPEGEKTFYSWLLEDAEQGLTEVELQQQCFENTTYISLIR